MKIFADVSSLAAASLTADQLVKVKGVGEYRIQDAGTGITLANSKIAVPQASGTAISVKQFGAVGDGVTDDTAAIQLALNSLIDGQTLDLVGGNYLIDLASRSNASYLSSAILYVGGLSNIRITNGKLLIDDSASAQIMLHAHNCTGVTVDNMVFDGQFTAWSGTYNTNQFGLGITKSDDVLVTGCKFENISNDALGITGDLSTSNPSWTANNIVVSNNIFEDYGQCSTSFMGANEITVTNNVFRNARVGAFKYGSRQANTTFMFESNKIEWDSGVVGYSDITGINGIVVLAELDTCAISNNIINMANCPVVANGINIGFDETNSTVTKNLVISNNVIRNGTGSSYAAFIHEGTLRVSVKSNVIESLVWGVVVDTYGAGTTLSKTPLILFSDNQFYNVTTCMRLSADAKAKAVKVTGNQSVNTTAKDYLFYQDSNADNIDYIDVSNNQAYLVKIPLRFGGVMNSVHVKGNNLVGSTTASVDTAIIITSDSATGKFTITDNTLDTYFKGIEVVRALGLAIGNNHFINVATAEIMNTNTSENHYLNTYDTVTTRLSQTSPATVIGDFSMASGSPNSVIYANKGSTVRTSNASAGTMFYVKESDSANTGWVNK